MNTNPSMCAFCDELAVDACPRCHRPCCKEHMPPGSGTWPASGYPTEELCVPCTNALGRHGRQVGRVVVAGTAAILGTVLASLVVLLCGGALGASADVIILCMLVAEVVGGAGAAYLADRQMQRWLLVRDQQERASLPEAKLLTRGPSK